MRFSASAPPNCPPISVSSYVRFGGGAHRCLSANLARREIRAVLDELRREMSEIVATAEPDICCRSYSKNQGAAGYVVAAPASRS
ncbi:hypothetical protein [Mycobacterium camsae]|uniref:hypothetical protein n=1 Tax=Mycobacterium gordonae TaxID=1778 RepID=UPI00197D997C|nr:hypothetical protein [Mycobacterium gordonae]